MSSPSTESVISVNDLAVSFRGCDALKGINFNVPPGNVFALLGENGAGKTTLIRCLTGFLHPTRGSCQVLGLDPQHRALEIRRRIGYVSDAPALYDWMKVGEIGWFAASFYDAGFIERYRESIEHFQVPEDRKIKHLSKGQRAKVALALSLAHDPELLILDEPTSGLDPLVRREFLESMITRVAMGRTVLLSSHQINEVERVADQVVILHEGKVKIAESMTRLRESIHEITITMSDSLAAIPLIASPVVVLSDQAVGRQRQLIVSNFVDELIEFLRSCPAVNQVTVRNASLEDLFAACVRGKGQLEQHMANENEAYRVLR